MVTRRQFLIGSAGVVAAGAAAGGVGLWRDPSLFGLSDQSNAAPKVSADVETGTLRSVHMASPVRWGLYVPDAQPLATLFSLHGRGEDHNTTFHELKLQNF